VVAAPAFFRFSDRLPHQNAKAPNPAKKSAPIETPTPIPAFVPVERPLVVDDEGVRVAELPLVESEGPDVLGFSEVYEVFDVLIVTFETLACNVGNVGGRVAEYALHRFVPTVYACCKSAALQAAIKHGETAPAPILHWQETSLGAQPAAEIAETRQDV
jgi:hypothetical protein